MSGEQLELFAADGLHAEPDTALPECPLIDAAALDDAALVDAMALSSATDTVLLAEEAGRRRLQAAVPALEALCRRLKGFGLRHRLREQTAALRALTQIGGAAAAEAVARIIADAVVQGPGLCDALAAASRLGCRLPSGLLPGWLRHADPAIRAEACRCVRPRQGVEALLIELLTDLNAPVALEAACALGRLGRPEGRPALLRLLQTTPSAESIDAVVPIADDDCLVQLARLGRARPHLLANVLEALDAIDHPRAEAIAAALRRDAARCT